MKGLIFAKNGIRYTVGIVYKNTYYHIYFRVGKKSKLLIGFNSYEDSIHLLQEVYFLGFKKI